MLSMAGLLLGLGALAWAGDVVVDPGDLVLLQGDHTIEVQRVGIPAPTVVTANHRLCKISVGWRQGEVVSSLAGPCHPNLEDEVRAAMSRWQLTVPEDMTRDQEILEAWYAFPTQEGGIVKTFVRQRYDMDLTLKLGGPVAPLAYRVRGRVFPKYPEEAVVLDTEVTQCDVKLDISPSGQPGLIVVERCDEVFHAPAEDALRKWRFAVPELDGVPFWSGVTLGVRFQRLYDDPEGKLGLVVVELPEDPDQGRAFKQRLDEALLEEEVREAPTWPPFVLFDHASYAEVGVYGFRWPENEPVEEERRCDLLFQVNSKRQTLVWPEEDCDASVRDASVLAANQWFLMHGEIERGERFARFRGTFVFPPVGEHVRLWVSEEDLVSGREAGREYVDTYQAPVAIRRVAPQLPRAFASEVLGGRVTCELVVVLSAGGRTEAVEVESCPSSYEPYALKALKKWRWSAAQVNGRGVRARKRVRVRFEDPISDAEQQAAE